MSLGQVLTRLSPNARIVRWYLRPMTQAAVMADLIPASRGMVTCLTSEGSLVEPSCAHQVRALS